MLFNRIPGSRDHLLGFDSMGIFKYEIEIATVCLEVGGNFIHTTVQISHLENDKKRG